MSVISVSVLEMTNTEIKDLGIKASNHRKRLLRVIEAYPHPKTPILHKIILNGHDYGDLKTPDEWFKV